jgi:hypothetical protein
MASVLADGLRDTRSDHGDPGKGLAGLAMDTLSDQ